MVALKKGSYLNKVVYLFYSFIDFKVLNKSIMKKGIIGSVILLVMLASCMSSKNQTSVNSKKVDETAVPVTSNTSADEMDLGGTWELISLINETMPINDIYSETKPTIVFDSRPKQVSGTTSCNTYTGSYSVDGRAISFGNGMAVTRMACPGNGESLFLERLNRVDTFLIKDQSTLMLLKGDVALLQFKKIMGPKSY